MYGEIDHVNGFTVTYMFMCDLCIVVFKQKNMILI